jgi:L-threonine-O-3-phosphate decarboxylase
MDFLRPELSQTYPTVHGALDFGELERAGLAPDSVLDFSVNSNPFGPSPTVRAALAQTPLDRYPDRESLALRRALAKRLDISPNQIVMGNGTVELIWLAAFAFLKPGEDALILGPTFGEYERAIRLMSATPQHWNALPVTGFAVNLAEITRRLDTIHYPLVFLCNPNNPTGQVISPSAILTWADAHPRTLFVVDEAYLAFVPDLESVLTFQRPNLLVLRSMTKDYALAGLRLGYAVGSESLIHALESVRPAWNVNALAQAAGLAALSDEVYYQAALTQLREEKTFLLNGLVQLGFSPVPSQTQFFLLPVENATQFRQNLLRQGILVRDCNSFGLPQHVRISPRTRPENQRLLDVLHPKECTLMALRNEN